MIQLASGCLRREGPSTSRLWRYGRDVRTMCALCGVLGGPGHWTDATPRPGLFTLGVDQVVRRTDDLVTWDKCADAPPAARSLCVIGESIFLGGTNGAIFKSQAR